MTLFVAAACGSGASGPPATAAPPSSAAPTASPDASAAGGSDAPVIYRFTFDEDAVLDRAGAGTSDLYINPGAVIEHEGVLHMFPNLFSQWPGRVRVPHLTSSDGSAWTLDETAEPLSSEDIPLADPGIDVSTGFVTDDGTWVLIFETVSSSRPWLLGRATAPSPAGPWTIDPEPIVEPGPAGTFDAGGVQWPSVVRHGDEYLLFYAGFDMPQGGNGSIGLATSLDGVTWAARDEPVFGATERWEGRSVDRPRVAATAGGLVMVYAGRDLTDRGIATSADGTTWSKVPGPSIERDDFPISARSWDAALLYRDGQLEYFLEIGFETTSIYRATLDWP